MSKKKKKTAFISHVIDTQIRLFSWILGAGQNCEVMWLRWQTCVLDRQSTDTVCCLITERFFFPECLFLEQQVTQITKKHSFTVNERLVIIRRQRSWLSRCVSVCSRLTACGNATITNKAEGWPSFPFLHHSSPSPHSYPLPPSLIPSRALSVHRQLFMCQWKLLLIKV